MESRKIIHIDMDAFYASVEQRDNPELRGKPIGVGGGERRGVLTTASYEARKFGVRSAMPGFKAIELCPELIFVSPRFDVYKEVSNQIREIFKSYTELIEPLSLDEAFLDVSTCKKDIAYATDIARAIKDDIFDKTKLTASAGVSYCKFIAKIASDIDKPNGLTVIKPHQAERFLEKLKVEKFFGVGKVTARKMNELGIFRGEDLKKWSEVDLIATFGKPGRFYFNIVRGIDNRPVQPNRERKSLAVERTSSRDISNLEDLEKWLDEIASKLKERLDRSNKYGRTLTLKLKDSDFEIITRSKSIKEKFDSKTSIMETALLLLRDNYEEGTAIRLLGLTVSNFIDERESPLSKNQLSLDL